MVVSRADYGSSGRIGVLVPRENPTVEAELSVLLEPDVAMMVARMTSQAPSMAGRLIDYGQDLHRWMSGLGDADLDGVAFACTGTSYLVGEAGRLPTSWSAFDGRRIPFVSASAAIEAALAELGSPTIALVSPYPNDLTHAAIAFWRRRGFRVMSVAELPPAPVRGHPIYAQSAAAVRAAAARATASEAQAVVILGTGAPSLPAIAAFDGAVPVLSSNLCLGWAIENALRGDSAADLRRWIAAEAPWRGRLRARFPSTRAAIQIGSRRNSA